MRFTAQRAVYSGLFLAFAGIAVTPARAVSEPSPRGGIGPDITFCQLYGLKQFGRVGDVVGMALTTTSWNLGDADAIWKAIPQEEHPFIVMNVYRLKEDRFEQIGQSWVKHGFFALSSEQCGTDCTYEDLPGHGIGDWLGMGCTDTYDAVLNADQGGLGPRYEINPWTGEYTYEGSHLSLPNHAHDGIEHRIQISDADLDPAQNSGATYYAEGYYAHLTDVNVLNSASWKEVTFTGEPGGTWTVGMSGAAVPPEIGFAIDAWTGADQVTLAQEVPPVEFVSPDGRCILASKVTDYGNSTWHYEYALLNIDMDRKVGEFSMPVAEGAYLSNVEFHAVMSHDEPYSNDAWTFEQTAGEIRWYTEDNPLRWGTLYNFRFDANVPPIETTVTLGLYEPGTPDVLTAVTTGPSLESPDCNDNGNPDGDDVSSGLSEDCNGNSTPDECEVPPIGSADNDCNENAIPDDCDLDSGLSSDCNGDGTPDECQLVNNDCNGNLIPDECDPRIILVSDSMETGEGWTVVDEDVTSGSWELADPQESMTSDGIITQPEDDNTPDGSFCFVTDGSADSNPGTFDLDGGPTRLISPSYDLSMGVGTLEYAYWLYNDDGDDVLEVEISNDDGAKWVSLFSIKGSASTWQTHTIELGDKIELTATTRLRFSIADQPNNSVTEAAIDDLVISTVDCTPMPPECEGDVNGDEVVDPLDSGFVLARFGCTVGQGNPDCDAADANGDGVVDPLDVGFVNARFGDCP